MYRILAYRFAFTLLGIITITTALSDVDQRCIAENSEVLSNDFLIGSWYEMYQFSHTKHLPSTTWCTKNVFTKPTAEVIAEYKAIYNDPNLPYSLDDNPVLVNNSRWVGMVTGNHIAKFLVLAPRSTRVLNNGYSVAAYRPLGDDYIMWHECSLRGNVMMLYAKNRYAPVSEMQELIRNNTKLRNLGSLRLCDTY